MSEEALRRALTELIAAKDAEYGINYAPGEQRLLNAWAAARAALSEGQAPEPVAQEPIGYVTQGGLCNLKLGQYAEVRGRGKDAYFTEPLYTHPAGMDAARAKAIEECAKVCDAMAETISPVRAKQCAAAIRALATKGAGS